MPADPGRFGFGERKRSHSYPFPILGRRKGHSSPYDRYFLGEFGGRGKWVTSFLPTRYPLGGYGDRKLAPSSTRYPLGGYGGGACFTLCSFEHGE